ncbi:MAG TPA: geranylgeranyl reductase family protein [Actinomycetota bacterium]|nr:geranylgeranyl reductase family protein [Actinomycetota bacterium]
MTEADVAIVGGGPAGAAAAYYLARRGHSVIVVEKKAFPREKVCGDGLTPRAVEVLCDMGLADELATWERVDGLRVRAAGRTMKLPFPKLARWGDYGLVKPRKDLDRIVLDNAESVGAKVLYETEAVEPIFSKGVATGVRAKRNGEFEEINAHFLLCAEGAASKFSPKLGRKRDQTYPMGFAIRQYYTSPMQHSGWFEAYLDVRSGPEALPGYGWVFPVGDGTANVGVGLLSTFGDWRSVNLRTLQQSFIESLPPEWEIRRDTAVGKPRAGRLFMGASVWPPSGPGFLIAGDAAGMVNPCNGEGIAYAYETGRMAARHLDDALRDGSGPMIPGYVDELKQTYGPYYRLGRRFVRVIGRPFVMEKLVAVGMRSEAIMNFALIVLANLEDSDRRTRGQRAFKALLKVAELKP